MLTLSYPQKHVRYNHNYKINTYTYEKYTNVHESYTNFGASAI